MIFATFLKQYKTTASPKYSVDQPSKADDCNKGPILAKKPYRIR